jgi:Protein of unknown function (DUF3489)
MTKANSKSQPRTKSPKRSQNKSNVTPAPRKAHGITKHDRVLGLLQTKSGTTIAAVSKATGWQPHSVRGFLAGVVKKKLGLTMTSEKTKSGRIYRIVGAKPLAPSRSAAVMQDSDNA